MKNSTAHILLAILLGPVTGPLLAQGQPEYCAFEVAVKSPTQTPMAGVLVEGTRHKGQVFGRALTDRRGIARICDAPVGLADLRVGGDRCGAVVVRYVQPLWMETRHILVIYANCSGEEWIPPSACQLTIRVRDTSDSPVPGVLLNFTSSQQRNAPGLQTRVSDEFGRIFRVIAYGETMTAKFSKEGYLPAELSEPCRPGESYRKERIVTMQRLAEQPK